MSLLDDMNTSSEENQTPAAVVRSRGAPQQSHLSPALIHRVQFLRESGSEAVLVPIAAFFEPSVRALHVTFPVESASEYVVFVADRFRSTARHHRNEVRRMMPPTARAPSLLYRWRDGRSSLPHQGRLCCKRPLWIGSVLMLLAETVSSRDPMQPGANVPY